mmetsp:Transcript_10081/g.14258  ORF Transcript_10081/g.14258 Transcript_10081/m.14258 type:complete len:80 (+) Transcript_10081:803-1042(+)
MTFCSSVSLSITSFPFNFFCHNYIHLRVVAERTHTHIFFLGMDLEITFSADCSMAAFRDVNLIIMKEADRTFTRGWCHA